MSEVVIFYDRYDERIISFILGPYDDLLDAQRAQNEAINAMGCDEYRPYSIIQLRSVNQIPAYEMDRESSYNATRVRVGASVAATVPSVAVTVPALRHDARLHANLMAGMRTYVRFLATTCLGSP